MAGLLFQQLPKEEEKKSRMKLRWSQVHIGPLDRMGGSSIRTVHKYKINIHSTHTHTYIYLYQWHTFLLVCVYVLRQKTREREGVYITVGVVGFSSAD